MKTTGRRPTARRTSDEEIAELRTRLREAQQTLRAIRDGEVDAMVVSDKKGPQIYTLEGAERAYRELIESMNEGALILAADKTILYTNWCFANMVKLPLQQVIGTSFRRFLIEKDRRILRSKMQHINRGGARLYMALRSGDGTSIPVLISIRPLGSPDSTGAATGMVVTDMSETKRTEELLRGLTHRLVQAQETERGQVALELHDHITQLLCAVHIRSQTLADKLSSRDPASKREAIALRDMLGEAADKVEHISRKLRPSILEHLGLVAVIRSDSAEFDKRTGMTITVNCAELTVRLSAEAELACYRILQEALKNVERHARASHVSVHLTQHGTFVEMVIHDDGAGFHHAHHTSGKKPANGFGLLSMRERAIGVGGTFKIKSTPGKGTTICARFPFGQIIKPTSTPPATTAA